MSRIATTVKIITFSKGIYQIRKENKILEILYILNTINTK